MQTKGLSLLPTTVAPREGFIPKGFGQKKKKKKKKKKRKKKKKKKKNKASHRSWYEKEGRHRCEKLEERRLPRKTGAVNRENSPVLGCLFAKRAV